jgi:hypothetical protein
MWFTIGIITGLVLAEFVASQFILRDEDNDDEEGTDDL